MFRHGEEVLQVGIGSGSGLLMASKFIAPHETNYKEIFFNPNFVPLHENITDGCISGIDTSTSVCFFAKL